MKSVKLFLGIMLCLVVLAGQAQAAVTLDFTKLTSLNDLQSLGDSNDISFTGGWAFEENEDVGNSITKRISIKSGDTSFINFEGSLPVSVDSFSYYFDSGTVEVKGLINNIWTSFGDLNLSSDDIFISTMPSSLGSAILTSISFTVKDKAKFYLQNFSYTPTPLPGAAILLGSGLLGLIGLRRREII